MKKMLFLVLMVAYLDANINAISRENGSGTRSAFVEIFDITKVIKDKKVDNISPKIAITNSTGVMITSVINDTKSLGYISFGALNDKVKPLEIDGVKANLENLKNGSYKISRPFNIATLKNSDLSDDFLAFLDSKTASKITTDLKYISLNEKDYISKKPSGKLVIQGSSSISPLMQKLAAEYEKLNENAKIDVLTSDSTMGVNSLIQGICDIAMLSREPKESELKKGIKVKTIAKDGIILIVNKQNPLNNLSKEQTKAIYEGKITKYEELSE